MSDGQSPVPKGQGTSAFSSADTPNPWHYKPWWCQPWSILLTGFGLIGGSWLLLGRWWVTLLVALPLLAWMGFFLLVWPRLMVESGLLDDLKAQPSKSEASS